MNRNVTIVTGLWDIGRNDLPDGFKRSFDHYLMKFAELLRCDAQMFIYAPKDLEDFVWSVRDPANTKIKIMELEDLKKWFPFYDKVQAIRTNPEWKEYAYWLMDSPQANLEMYNPIVMSKMFMLNDVSIFNPFGSEYYFWIDGGITNTVHWGYFSKDKVFDNLPYYYDINNKFLFLSYPYEGNDEIHGFRREEMAKYCDTDYVRYVNRGGFFGARKDHLNQINGIYYNFLQSTLHEGLMGTEECISTIISHRHPDLVHRFEIEGNGLIAPFFEYLKNVKQTVKLTAKGRKPFTECKVALYVITFNSDGQLNHLLSSWEKSDPDFLNKPHKKILLNNSTDRSTDEGYNELCEKYGFEEIKKDNIGIHRGRVWCAEHFDESDCDYSYVFEDDFCLFPKGTQTTDKFGFRNYIDNLYDKSLKIAHEESYDYIKLTFNELFGDNSKCWPFCNVPQDIRERYFPENPKKADLTTNDNLPYTAFKNIKNMHGIGYIDGHIYYSNWPMIITREGNKKVFLETKFQYPNEATQMSLVYQKQQKGEITAAVLLLTPINHDRIYYYGAEERKEN